jgi:hypothetical protein
MTPAAYHRQVEPGTVTEVFVKLASWFVTAAMVPLMRAVCLEVYRLGHMVLGGKGISLAVAGMLFMLFAGLWFVFPQVMRRRRGSHRPSAWSNRVRGGLRQR